MEKQYVLEKKSELWERTGAIRGRPKIVTDIYPSMNRMWYIIMLCLSTSFILNE